MNNREKIIKALDLFCLTPTRKNCYEEPYIMRQCCEAYNCPYFGYCEDLLFNVLELLKAQEPIEPEEIINDKYPVGDINRCCGWRCGKCKETIPGDADFCPNCGKAVSWNG